MEEKNMAESMQGLKRSHRCAELSKANIGETVTVMGWVQKNRNKGGIVFVDLRDRSGLLQIIFENGSIDEAGFEKAGKLRSEFVIAVVGTVEARSGAVNENLATGEIEIRAREIRILSESETPPFPIEENSKTKEELRLKYRFLDLRRPDLQRNLMMRSKAATLTRQFLAEEGFLEIETPMLIKSTPEGARDYLVPSRVHPGNFYALPQSPQIFKQLLMCSGYDRYFQIVKCFRDEDLRADRQPEFTQIDMELSFVDVDDVIDVNERLLAKLFKEILGVEVSLPIPRMTWQEAMDRFGSDKPDIRFGMELVDVSEVVKDCEFVVFKNALENGGSVRGINAKGQGAMPRKKIDKLVDFAKDFGAKGLAYIAIQEDGTVKSSFAKFMSEEEMHALIEAMGGENGDLLLFAADKNKVVWDVLSTIHPYLKELADISGETVHLVKRDGLDVVYIDKVESSSNSVRMVSRVGSRTPMYRSGVGKALLAMMRPEEVRTIWGDSKIEALTEYTVTDLDELFIILEEARENGYALDNEENENGVRCIASSIMDYSGKPKYAFSISGPTVRMTDERILELSKLMLQTKKKLEEELGYHS